MKISLVQRKHVLGDSKKNLGIIEEEIVKTESDMLIFPEMFLTGYGIGDEYWRIAETIPGRTSKRISQLAVENDVTVVCGMPERPAEDIGRLFNSALVCTPCGGTEVYRKTYLANFGPFDDMRYFVPDDHLPLFDTPVGRMGVVICYDIFFPELTKYYAMNGADIIVCISASPSTTREFFEKVLTARAIETTCFVLHSNLLGREGQMEFWGGSRAISPRGEILALASYYKEDIVEVSLDTDDLYKARIGRPVLADTRNLGSHQVDD